jgi:hypothetical protein
MLCGVMWGLNRFQRPAWTTASLIPLGFICGISSAVFIWRGGQKTKRTKKVEQILRQALEMEEANGGHSKELTMVQANGKQVDIKADLVPGDRTSNILVDEEQTVPANVSPQGH